jgi:ParB-like chromosome segregation protein Spo0J
MNLFNQEQTLDANIIYEVEKINEQIKNLLNSITNDRFKVLTINEFKLALHEVSPLKNEPVDCVIWVDSSYIKANDYNPNSVAPPEMELLKLSIMSDGYTQPIVTMQSEDIREVIDGFHRNRVGKECQEVNDRILNFLPVVTIRADREDKADRMAATVRHNRARGKHSVTSMSDIVVELKRRNWNDDKIAKHLGMDSDEVLRLYQITGLTQMFEDKEFSEAWEIDSEIEDISSLDSF